MRALSARLIGALALLFSTPTVPAYALPQDLVVRVYDIGQGSCVLIECPDDLPILIDCGKMGKGGGSIQAAGEKINAVLATYDEPKPLRVILSHGDLDHYSLLSTRKGNGFLLDPKHARHIYFGGAFNDYGGARRWIHAAHRELSAAKRDYPLQRPCYTPARISCLNPNEARFGSIRKISCGNAQLDLLTANAQAYYTRNRGEFPGTDWMSDGRKNADSAVVRVRYGSTSFVITGDAQEMTEQLAMRNADRASLPVTGTTFLFGSHHGSRHDGSNGPVWIEATSPRVVIFSSNQGGGHGHPACEVVSAFDTAGYPDGGEMAVAEGGMPLRCGRSEDVTSVAHKFLVTEANRDITITVRENEDPTIECASHTKACDW